MARLSGSATTPVHARRAQNKFVRCGSCKVPLCSSCITLLRARRTHTMLLSDGGRPVHQGLSVRPTTSVPSELCLCPSKGFGHPPSDTVQHPTNEQAPHQSNEAC